MKQKNSSGASFGEGVYVTKFGPSHFRSKDGVCMNNYSNAEDPEEQQSQMRKWKDEGRQQRPTWNVKGDNEDQIETWREATETKYQGSWRW